MLRSYQGGAPLPEPGEGSVPTFGFGEPQQGLPHGHRTQAWNARARGPPRDSGRIPFGLAFVLYLTFVGILSTWYMVTLARGIHAMHTASSPDQCPDPTPAHSMLSSMMGGRRRSLLAKKGGAGGSGGGHRAGGGAQPVSAWPFAVTPAAPAVAPAPGPAPGPAAGPAATPADAPTPAIVGWQIIPIPGFGGAPGPAPAPAPFPAAAPIPESSAAFRPVSAVTAQQDHIGFGIAAGPVTAIGPYKAQPLGSGGSGGMFGFQQAGGAMSSGAMPGGSGGPAGAPGGATGGLASAQQSGGGMSQRLWAGFAVLSPLTGYAFAFVPALLLSIRTPNVYLEVLIGLMFATGVAIFAAALSPIAGAFHSHTADAAAVGAAMLLTAVWFWRSGAFEDFDRKLLRDTLSVSARAIQPNLGAVGAHFGLSAALLAFFALLACAVVAASTTVQANPRAGPNPPGSGPGCVHDPMGGRHAAPSPAGSPAAAAAAPGAGQSAAAGLMGGGPTDGGVVPCCWLVIHWPNPQFLALAVVAAYWVRCFAQTVRHFAVSWVLSEWYGQPTQARFPNPAARTEFLRGGTPSAAMAAVRAAASPAEAGGAVAHASAVVPPSEALRIVSAAMRQRLSAGGDSWSQNEGCCCTQRSLDKLQLSCISGCAAEVSWVSAFAVPRAAAASAAAASAAAGGCSGGGGEQQQPPWSFAEASEDAMARLRRLRLDPSTAWDAPTRVIVFLSSLTACAAAFAVASLAIYIAGPGALMFKEIPALEQLGLRNLGTLKKLWAEVIIAAAQNPVPVILATYFATFQLLQFQYSLLLDGVSALYYCCFARDLDEGVERWGELHRVFFRLPGAAEAAKDAGPAAMARGARLGEGADEAFLPPEFEVGASPAVWKL